MREQKFTVGSPGYMPSQSKPLSTEVSHAEVAGENAGPANSTLESQAKARATWTCRSVVSCLLGSLILMLAMVVAPTRSSAAVEILVSFGPPAIPVYAQPPCPAPGYIWTPGYWAWDPDYGYYWVPGTWVPAPFVGAMWTPGYWGWYNGGYVWYTGYWGTAVGFYGGINYGYGYTGHGYYGGYWRGGRFYYNRSANRITNLNIRTVYNQRVVVNENGPHISYNGGRGGIDTRPTAEQMAAARTRRFGAINQQLQQERFARTEPAQRARQNGGRPGIAATARPGEFRGSGAVRATRAGAPYREPDQRTGGREAGRRAAPAPVQRAPARNAPRRAEPSRQMERSTAPQPRNERPAYRNASPGAAQRNQREERPREVRRPEGRTQEKNAHPQNQGSHRGENGHGPGRSR